MKTRTIVPATRILALASGLAAAGPCLAQTDSFHLMQVQMIIGGVNGDTTAQAVQLRMRTGFQNLVQQGRVKVFDAAGLNPVIIVAPTTSVPNGAGGDTVLITTPSFDAATSPTCQFDFHMTNPIPASYLAAGRLTWEDNFGTILWSVAWGGAAYTGPNTGSITNSPTGNFGPPFAGPLPSTGTQALAFQGDFTAAAGANNTDYALTPGAAVFTDNLRASFTVVGASCYPNCDGSTSAPILNISDFICFQSAFAAGNSYANCDNSTSPPVLNISDFICFQGRFAAGCN